MPLLWLLWNRLWLIALLVFAVEILGGLAATRLNLAPGFSILVGFAIMILVGLEGRRWLCHRLERQGYRLVDLVHAETTEAALARALASIEPMKDMGPSPQFDRGPISRGVIGLFPTPDTMK